MTTKSESYPIKLPTNSLPSHGNLPEQLLRRTDHRIDNLPDYEDLLILFNSTGSYRLQTLDLPEYVTSHLPSNFNEANNNAASASIKPYSIDSFNLISRLAPLIIEFSNLHQISKVAIAGAIADEFSARQEAYLGLKGLIDKTQDAIVPAWSVLEAQKALTKPLIAAAILLLPLDIKTKLAATYLIINGLNRLGKQDVGYGNVNIDTARGVYEQFPSKFPNISKQELIKYLVSDRGHVNVVALVMLKTQEDQRIIDIMKNIKNHHDDLNDSQIRDAILICVYKRGVDKFLKSYEENGNADGHVPQAPETIRLNSNRQALEDALDRGMKTAAQSKKAP